VSTDGGKKANDWARKNLGADVDAAAGAAGLRIVGKDGGGEGDGDEFGGLPWIELPGVGLRITTFAHELGNAMANKPVFRRGKNPVTVDQESGMVEAITPDEFRTIAEQYAVTYKLKEVMRTEVDAKGKEYRKRDYENEPTTMPKDVASAVLRSNEFIYALRPIDRVNYVRMPVVQADGQPVLLPEGYDEGSKTFTMKSPIKINENLTPEEGQEIIKGYIAEFPFTDGRSKAVAVAGMVAIFVSQMQELTASRMCFVNRSNVEGAGKSLCAAVALSPAYGLVKGQPLSDRQELRKLLDATAQAGLPYIFLDNLTGYVASELLDSYLTTPIWTGRLLGTPKIFEAPANAMLFITGNGITLSPDIARRSLVCNLHVEEADPDARQPKRVMTPQFLARPAVRGDFLSALWAMVRGWVAKGKPGGSRKIRSFEEWCEIVGGIVLCNGFGDALEKPSDDETANTKEVDKRLVVEKLVSCFPENARTCEFKFEEIIDLCREHILFEWAIEGKVVKERERLDNGDYETSERFECTKATVSKMGKIFGEEMAGQKYRLKDGRRVQFGKRGKQRHRRYVLELLEDGGVRVAPPHAGADSANR
jgi:hypothetical protein